MKSTELRPGLGVRMDGKLFVITQFEHRTPGNLRAFIQVKLREIDRRDMEFLFTDGTGGGTFMDLSTYDQVEISGDTLGDAMLFLPPNARCIVLFHEQNAVSIELPPSVELTITDTPPGIKGATATNQLKEAICDTGLKTRVPSFIEMGERIRVSTADGSYQSRA